MKNLDKIIKSAAAAFLTLATVHTTFAATDPAELNTEKCYGVSKAQLNDCKTATASCAGSATKDGQPDAFVLVPKGLCDKLVNGSLTEKKS